MSEEGTSKALTKEKSAVGRNQEGLVERGILLRSTERKGKEKLGARVTRLASSSAGLAGRVQSGRPGGAPASSFLWYVRRGHKGEGPEGCVWGLLE